MNLPLLFAVAFFGFLAWILFCIYFLMPVELKDKKVFLYFLRLIPVTLVSTNNIKEAFLLSQKRIDLSLFRTMFFINKLFSPIVIIEKKKGFFRLAITPKNPEDFLCRIKSRDAESQGI
jgi:hypothetical protein